MKIIKGYKFTEEHRKKISETRKRRIAEGKIKSPWNKGKKVPQISGKNHWLYNNKFSEETIKKMRKSHLGKTTSKRQKETTRKFFLTNNPMKRPEIAKKISEIMKKQYKEGIRKSSQEGKPLSNYQKECLRQSKLGNKNPRWNGGTSYEPYDSTWCKKIKREIRQRDNQICMNCGIHREKLNQALHIHHINYDKKISIPENLISLCQTCHNFTLKNREYWIKLFQEKLSKLYNYVYKDSLPVINLEVKNAY